MNYKFAQLSQSPGKSGKTVSEVYIAQVDSYKEELAGKLFILIEIDENSVDSLKIINFLIDSIVHNFYQNEKLLLRERMPNLKVEHIFEAGLAKTNKQFVDFLKEHHISKNINEISITACVVFDNELYLANAGKNNTFLIFPTDDKTNTDNNNFNIINILKDKEKNSIKNNYHLFSNIISGQIPQNGSIFMTNETLPEYISQTQILNITSSLPPTSAIEQIKNTINNINSYVSFAGIIIKNVHFEKKDEIPTINTKSSHASVISLNETENITEALLTPSGVINFKKWLKLISFTSIFRNKRNKNKTSLSLKDKIHVKKKSLFKESFLQIFIFFKNIFTTLFRLLLSLNNKNFLKKIFNAMSINGKLLNILKTKYQILISNKKTLLFISAFFIIIFLFNLSNTKKNNQIKEDIKKYDDISQTIEQKQNQAEASLLYSNDEGAKKLFDEINTLLEELPQNTEKEQIEYQNFKNKYDNQLEKIRRIVKIDGAQELIDFNNLNSRSQTSNIVYIPDTNKLYASDASLKSVYTLDLFDDISATITNLKDSIQYLNYPLIFKNENKEQIFYFNNNNIVSLDINDDSFSTININLENFEAMSGSGIYNSKLYTMDISKNSIYSFSITEQGLGSPTSWLNKKIDLSQAVDLSIDGNIYVLNKNASVIKLLRGERVAFDLEPTDPPLKETSKIVVSKDLDFIYILETKSNRLVVFDKKGQFLMQYQSDRLNQLKDFAVDEQKQIIYFLNGSKIFKFNATHF